MNTQQLDGKTEPQAEPQKKAAPKLTLRTGIRGGLAVRLMID